MRALYNLLTILKGVARRPAGTSPGFREGAGFGAFRAAVLKDDARQARTTKTPPRAGGRASQPKTFLTSPTLGEAAKVKRQTLGVA